MTRLVGYWLTLLIFLSGPALEEKVRFGDFTIAAESGPARLVHGDLVGKSAAEIRALVSEKGLVPHPTKPGKWMDPVTGKERLRIDPGHVDSKTGLPYNDPKAAVPHHHGYGPDGKTKIVDPSDNNPHFPTK